MLINAKLLGMVMRSGAKVVVRRSLIRILVLVVAELLLRLLLLLLLEHLRIV